MSDGDPTFVLVTDFTVHTIAASHFRPITQPAEVADILTAASAA